MSRISTLLVFLALAALGCYLNLGGPQPPGNPIPVSQEAADELQNMWRSALQDDGRIEVVVSEEQLTSFIALKLAEVSDPLIENPQVYLRDGLVQIYGTARGDNFSSSALISLSASLDEEGIPSFAITEADFGPLPVPESLLSSLSSTLNDTLSGQFGSLASGVKISSITIANGQMSIAGEKR